MRARRQTIFALLASSSLALAGLFSSAAGCGGDDATSSSGDDGGSGDGSIDQSLGDSSSADGASGDGSSDAGSAHDGDAASFPTPDAAPFVTDTSYGNNGVVTANFGTAGAYEVWSLARQSDGKLLVGGGAGQIAGEGGQSIYVARYTSGGALDTTFGSNGIAFLPVGGYGGARAVLVESDQKIVVVGETNVLGGAKTVVGRFDSAGAIDTTFGNGGYSLVDGYAWSGALQSDGAILAAANAAPGILVYRFLSNGMLDTSFGTNGLASSGSIGLYIDDFCVMAQADGKILVGGNVGGFTSFFARFTANGMIDNSFGDAGAMTEFPSSSQISEIDSLMQEPDGGRIYAAGLAQGTFGLGRYLLDGGRDPSFGPGSIPGWSTRGPGDYTSGLAMQGDGQLLVGGRPTSQAGVVRFAPDGGVDTSFGTSGFGHASISDTASHGVVWNPDGTIVVSGDNGGSIQVARLTSAGANDATFGTNGVTTTSGITGTTDDGLALALQPSDGKAVLFGQTGSSTNAMIRVTTAGALDTTLAGTGKKVNGTPAAPGSVVAQSTSKTVVASSGQTGIKIARFDTAGAPDGTFGTSGTTVVTTIGGHSVIGTRVALGPSDALVATGGLTSGASGFAVVKLTAEGQPDGAFGTSGAVSTLASVFGATIAGADAAAIQADGKVVAAGRVDNGLGVARYTSAGVLDTTFGIGGVTKVALGAQTYGDAVLLQNDGSYLVVGERFNANLTSDVVVLHVTADGALDPGFGIAAGIGGYPLGVVERPGTDPVPLGVARAQDGRLVVAASTSSDGGTLRLLLLRFSNSGLVDAKSVIALSPGSDVAHGVAMQSDGKLVVGGRTWTPAGGPDFFVARFSAPP